MKKSISLLLTLVLVFSLFSVIGINALATTDAEYLLTINKDWSIAPITVIDNYHFTDALNYKRDSGTMSAAASEGTLGGNMTVYNIADYPDDKVFTYDTYGTLRSWISTGGNYRFWIKTPDYDGEKIALRLNFSAYINDKSNENYDYNSYPSINSDIEVVADGKWHEVIGDYSSNTEAQKTALYSLVTPTAKNGYTLTGEEPKKEKTNFYLKVYNKSIKEITKSDLQYSHIEFHFTAPTALGDGNLVIPDAPISTINKDWSIAPITVTDNRNFTNALNYKRTPDPTMSSAASEGALGGNMTVYNTADYPDDKVFTYDTYGTLRSWISTGGNYRFWIKTPNYSGNKITLRLNFTAFIDESNDDYSYSAYPSVNSDIEVVADGEWHEIIGDFSNNTNEQKAALYALVSPTAKQGYTLTGEEPQKQKTNFYLRIYNKSTREIIKSDLQFSHIEFHFSEPTVLGSGQKYYEKIAVFSSPTDSATVTYASGTTYAMDRTMPLCDDLPFFNKANTYKTGENYVANNGNKTFGFLRVYKVAIEDFINNNNAEIRFWVRTATTKSFAFNLVIRNKDGKDSSIVVMHRYPITVEGKDGWQEIRIPRSVFQDNPSDMFKEASTQSDCTYVQFGFTVLGSETNQYKGYTQYPTFTADDCIEFSNVIEMYNDKAYDKGDANRDGEIDIRDLVRTKVQSTKLDVNVGNCDIDNDSKIGATDMTYLRKYLLIGAWK